MRTKLAFPLLLMSAIVIAIPPAVAGGMEGHTVVTPQEVKWGPAPAVLPPGAQIAVLFGDPSKEGLFGMRAKFPKGYVIAPHTHPGHEVVTVISGTFKLGMGKTADPGKAQALPAGSFFALPPDSAHFAYADEDTVVQITTNGPWSLTYVNPDDDPRKSQ